MLYVYVKLSRLLKNLKSSDKKNNLKIPKGYMSSPPVFSGVRVARSLVLCVLFCRTLFVILCFFFRPLCCLFFFDLRFLITPLASTNSSYLSVKYFVDHCLSFCAFSFGHWIVCTSMYGFWSSVVSSNFSYDSIWLCQNS
jgi:hypothetical protein